MHMATDGIDLPIAAFAEHLRTNTRDREALLALIGDGGDASVIADFARRRGFKVSPQEVTAFFAAVADENGELSDGDLSDISGGLTKDFLKSVAELLERISKHSPGFPRI